MGLRKEKMLNNKYFFMLKKKKIFFHDLHMYPHQSESKSYSLIQHTINKK